jgi:hypothetical protein
MTTWTSPYELSIFVIFSFDVYVLRNFSYQLSIIVTDSILDILAVLYQSHAHFNKGLVWFMVFNSTFNNI